MNPPYHPQETAKNPHPAETFFRTVDVDKSVVQKVQRQNGLYCIHASADGLQLLDDLLHNIALWRQFRYICCDTAKFKHRKMNFEMNLFLLNIIC